MNALRERCLRVDLAVLLHAGDDEGHRHIEEGADDEGAEDAARQVTLRVLRLLGGGGNHVEPDVGEEDEGGCGHDAEHAERRRRHARDELHHGCVDALGSLRARGRRRDERSPVVAVDEADASEDDEEHDEELDADEHEVDAHRLLDALGDEKRQADDQDEGGEVEVPALGRPQEAGHVTPSWSEQRDEVRGPTLGHDARAEHQLEEQVPADGPRDDLAERRVGEGVGRAGHRHRGGELRVAEGREAAHDRPDDERVDDGRAGVLLGRAPGHREDTGTDDDADAEDDEVERREPSFQVVVGSSAAAIEASIDLVRNRLMLTSDVAVAGGSSQT